MPSIARVYDYWLGGAWLTAVRLTCVWWTGHCGSVAAADTGLTDADNREA